MKTCWPPMLERPAYIGRRPPNSTQRARREGWPECMCEVRKPCPDCDGWISLNYDHNPNCPRLDYLKEPNRYRKRRR